MKRFFCLLLVLMVCACAFAQNGVPRVNKTLPFSKGINLTVWMEYSRMNTLMYGRKDFENIKSLGVEVIRLPVWFEIWNDGAPGYKVSDECWQLLDNAVDWCEELGMSIIIDFHNDCNGTSKTDPKIEQVLLKVWPQVAERYKNRGEFILYEIMNEPHFSSGNIDSDIKKWGKIQGNVLKAIREIDQKHYIVVGGGDWNSIGSMMKLPDYKDEKLVYNFHDYSPFLFTHQGAGWTDIKRLKNIPFPYSKEKMPPLPKNPTNAEKWYYQNYKKDSSEETLVAPLNKAVEFANKRNACLMCNEFGVYMPYADVEERANWYRLKLGWMDGRGICRISWDYMGDIGLFVSSAETRFPEDLNVPVVKSMGYKIPDGKSESWMSRAKKTGDYTLYKDGDVGLLRTHASGDIKGSFTYIERKGEKPVIFLSQINRYGELSFLFGETTDFSALKDEGAKLEFFIKSSDKNLDLSVYFRDDESKIFPWRASTSVKASSFKADGQWHKVSIPLKSLNDVGGWSSVTDWKNGEGKFSWQLVDSLVFQNNDKDSTEGFYLKDIRIVK
ncbi:MAG: glycoside hydrolase family 5 protein [Spirochaetaceae bacterium]|nr:glycoside hydrolase family 5 protein [Spirochaetaceae bacterium]